MTPPSQILQALRDWRTYTKPIAWLMLLTSAAAGGVVALGVQAMIEAGTIWTTSPPLATLLMFVCIASCLVGYIWWRRASRSLQRETGYSSLSRLLEEGR